MDGEFQQEDIIASVQYADIAESQQKWYEEHLGDDEWKNPYYGFPQMIRFAFNLNQSSINRLNLLKDEGIDYRLNVLLRPQSLNKDADGKYKKFVYEQEVLDLLMAIDGKKRDDNIFSFLNYEKIKEGKMCRHIVMVLDTMIFLRGASSPQEYDQAIYRLQSQYVKTIKTEDKNVEEENKTVVYNMKPQTLLVDFDPTRMFVMQNRKSLIGNINAYVRGDDAGEGKKDGKPTDSKPQNDELKSFRKRLQTFYFKTLLFAYLSDLEEKNLSDIIHNAENNEDGKRIAKNIQLDIEGLKQIKATINPGALSEWELKIHNIDTLSGDFDADMQTALRRFSRLSNAEVTTPDWVADEMVAALPEYECTRKIYGMLGLPLENIITDFTTYDLIYREDKEELIKKLKNMNFNAVVGNPPYQEPTKDTSDRPIYNYFCTRKS